MSLVVLKRKAGTKYGKLSSRGNNGFSLNNPRRIESKMGRMRIQSQTPMNGTAYRGHGGCCGTYPTKVIKSQYVNDNPHVRVFVDDKHNVGISVKNHSGSIATRHKWMKRGYPHYVTKDMRTKTYQEYVEAKAAQVGASEYGEQGKTFQCGNGDDDSKCYKSEANIVKKVDTLSQSEYLKTKFMNKNCLPTPYSKRPIPTPMPAHCGSCNVECADDLATSSEKGNCA